MSTDSVEKYKNLLSKQQKVGDKYVIIDQKWFEHWKRFSGLEKTDEANVPDPGPINFTELVKTEAASSEEVQLRDDAVEGNDFTFIPLDLYKDLKQKHGSTGQEIIRTVVPRGDWDTAIETFLVPLRICSSKTSRSTIKQIYRSRRTPVDDIKNEICNEFRIASHTNNRLLTKAEEINSDWEVVDYKNGSLLEEIDLTKNAVLTYDAKPSSPSTASRFGSLFRSQTYTAGLCGLSNLGNTCFMNSALQCLSNVPSLTKYFLDNEYKGHINRENPLGMKGDVAEAYGQLIHEMWSGRSGSCAPKNLKHSVARYAPQFSGYAQQDSQEFMSFLLDGLHEDLNRVRQKPYMDKKDDDGKTNDAALATEQWEYYKKRNESKIQEIFHGQIKSTVQCLKCGTIGRTFDPICFLSLPLPGKSKMRVFKITYIRLNGRIKTYSIRFDEHLRMSNLVEAFCEAFQPRKQTEPMDTEDQKATDKDDGESSLNDNEEIDDEREDFTKDPDYDKHEPKPNYILMAEVFSHRIQLQYQDNNQLTNILDRDHIVFYETSQPMKGGTSDTILMPCVFREENTKQNFGYPIYLTIPRHGCTGRDIQNALDESIGNFLPAIDKSLYAASCQLTRNYNQQVKKIENILDDKIDFSLYNASLVCEVASAVVEKYKLQEEERQKQENNTSNSTNNNNNNNNNNNQTPQKTTLTDCFRLFTKRETLSTNDLWMCTKCKVLQRASKKIDLWLLPKILIVQLKRFHYNRYYRDKIDQFIDCPLRDLDLSQFVINPKEKSNTKYDLIAVSNHMGGLGGGHYTAYGKNSVDKKWHSFDDSYVGDANEDNIITKSAYVLIYQQQEQTTGDDSVKKSK